MMRVRVCRRYASTFSMALKDVSKALPSGRKLFDRVHLNFLDGAKIGLIGPNGAGKSSLLKIVGKIQNDGFDGVRFFCFHLRLETKHTHTHRRYGTKKIFVWDILNRNPYWKTDPQCGTTFQWEYTRK